MKPQEVLDMEGRLASTDESYESLAIDDITSETYITVWVACILESRTMAIIVACRSNVNVVQ